MAYHLHLRTEVTIVGSTYHSQQLHFGGIYTCLFALFSFLNGFLFLNALSSSIKGNKTSVEFEDILRSCLFLFLLQISVNIRLMYIYKTDLSITIKSDCFCEVSFYSIISYLSIFIPFI